MHTGYLLLVLAALLAVVCAKSLEERIIDQLTAYEASQNSMNATAAAILFTSKAVANVPLGANSVSGNANIKNFFAGFFSSIKYLIEDVLGEWVVIGNYASGSKLLLTAVNPACPVSLVVNQYFTFDNSTDPPLIASFNVMWNVTKASCQGAYPLSDERRQLLALYEY